MTATTMSARSPARGGASSQLDSPRSSSIDRLATLKGHDVDQPRNLAKSVTVE